MKKLFILFSGLALAANFSVHAGPSPGKAPAGIKFLKSTTVKPPHRAETNTTEVYSQTFDTQEAFNTFTTIDVNADKITWSFVDGAARIETNEDKAMNDWLISAPVKLETGKTYTLTYDAWGQRAGDTNRIQLRWGKDKTAAGMTLGSTSLVTISDAIATKPKAMTATITVTESGTYYIGILGRSSSDEGYFCIDNIKLTTEGSTEPDPNPDPDPDPDALKPPYTQTFDTQDAFKTMSVINTNNDKYTWEYNNGTARLEAYNDMNDWLVTPALYLEAGQSYDLSFKAWGSSASSKHRLSVKWGKAATAAGMTLGQTTFTTFNQTTAAKPKVFSLTVSVEETGVYYLGLWCRSTEDNDYLYVDDISLQAPVSSAIPASPTDLKVTPDPEGNVKATISLKAPTLDDSGNELKSLTKISLYRGETLIHTFTTPQPGAGLSYTDTPATAGDYTYKAMASNEAGDGREASITAYVGLNFPAAVASASVIETVNDGEVTVKWAEVSTDVKGNPINPGLVSYEIAKYEGNAWTPIYTDVKGTSKTFRAVDADAIQEFVYYGVFSKNSRGKGSVVQTNLVAVGKPYESLHESFENGEIKTAIGSRKLQGHGEWATITDSISSVKSQDEDNGMISFLMDERDDRAEITFGKVSLAKMNKPMLSLYTYIQYDEKTKNSNLLKIEVLPMGEDAVTLFDGKTGDIATAAGWERMIYSLGKYAGKSVCLRITAQANCYRRSFFDNIVIDNILENDISLGEPTVPKKLRAGKDYNLEITVFNDALAQSGTYTIELYQDGNLVETRNFEPLEAGSKRTATFTRTLPALAKDVTKFYAVLETDKDDNLANNVSKEVSLRPIIAREPAPASLVASRQATALQLNWSAPDLLASGDEIKEGFEDINGFNHSFAGWTFVDMDKKAVGGISAVEIPGIKINSTKASFFTFDTSHRDMAGQISAHTGDIFLASLYANDDSQVDDWAISPLLDGKEQTISFWARSLDGEYPETIEVSWSNGSVTPADFTTVLTVKAVAANWTKYEAKLPAGAKRFAVRSCAKGAFMLMIDDFTYRQGAVFSDYVVKGYNVYREGKKINSQLVTTTSYTDTATDSNIDDSHSYVVTAVYSLPDGELESGPSNEAMVTAGLDGISYDSSKPEISTSAGMLTVSNAEGLTVTVYTPDGRKAAETRGNARISLAQGIYLVNVGKFTFKVYIP